MEKAVRRGVKPDTETAKVQKGIRKGINLKFNPDLFMMSTHIMKISPHN